MHFQLWLMNGIRGAGDVSKRQEKQTIIVCLWAEGRLAAATIHFGSKDNKPNAENDND
jgi:hypothetical protein